MPSPDIQPQKEARRQLSLVRKLAFLEMGRRFWLLVGTDILIILLFLGSLIVRCERVAKQIATDGSPNHVSGLTITETDGTPYGFLSAVPSRKIFINKAIRRLWFEESLQLDTLASLSSLNYMIAITDDETEFVPTFTVFTFSLAEAVILFEYAFIVLLALEAVGLIGDAFKIRHSIRRTLRPIYDLTLAAQNMSIRANPVIKLPDARDLRLSGAIDTLNDITENSLGRRIEISDERDELRGLAGAINAMLERLDAAYSSQLRFVSDASHELRTPIAVIQGYANLLDRWGKNDAVTLQESIDAIKAEATGMQDLVEQLLFLARSDNRSIVLNVETVDTCALCDEVFRETRMIDPSHEFSAKIDGKLTVRGDVQLLKQAIRIFVDNAIKYTPKSGRITISTIAEQDDGQDYVKISVSDTGIGIPDEDLSRVFDRFFRADESRARETGGTGLGLSIAKWIVDRHGGFVEIISREDVGTKITVALPIYNE